MAKIGSSRHRDLVYTSAGACSNVRLWLEGDKRFDLWVTDYGEREDLHEALADHHDARAGKKFPNLWHARRTWPEVFDRYDAVFVADDDLVLDATAISRLFAIRREHDLWLLQPAFLQSGVVSHPITCVHPWFRLRWTSFVEVTCPLFLRERLDRFLDVYDPAVVGWGVDWWYLDVLGSASDRRIAIVDEVPCENPRPETKRVPFETDDPRYAAFHRDRQRRAWERIRREQNISVPERAFVTYGGIPVRSARAAWARVAHRARTLYEAWRGRPAPLPPPPRGTRPPA